MEIPKIIQETAKKHGFNSVNYVGEIDGSQVFGCSEIGKDGLAVPQGLPTLILLKNGETKFINGNEGLELASRLVKSWSELRVDDFIVNSENPDKVLNHQG